jgi:hypothetical protein
VVAPANEMIAALAAPGPWPAHAEKLMLFGRFVGAWDVDVTLFDLDGSVSAEGRGEWLFGWVLEGRAVQDVRIRPPRGDRATLSESEFWEYGTTLRVYEPETDSWRVTWSAPVQGRGLSLVARAVGDEIVLDSEIQEPLAFRWVFSEIEDNSCLWRGSATDDRGETWLLLQEMWLRRRPAGPAR